MKWVRISKITLLGIAFLLAWASQGIAGTIYVNNDASGGNNGTSWTDAYTSLQSALTAASSGDQIWVAAGTYKPGAARTNSFSMKNGVAIYGGFAGYEDPCSFDLASRDFEANETILSGDIGTPDVNTDNCYHVVYSGSVNVTAILDGFTITGGNANGTHPNNKGGGMYNINSSPTVANCNFTGNSAVYGGGMFNMEGNPTITNCTFSGNSAGDGGGMHNDYSSLTVTNCTFSGNSADAGGVMFNMGGNPTFTNCTFSGNSAGGGSVMANWGSSSTLTNCILWGDTPDEIHDEFGDLIITYSDVEGGTGQGWFGAGCIDADPCFIDANAGDLRLKPNSPCIDAGNNTAVPSSVLKDIAGKLRFADDPYAPDTGDAGTTGRPVVDMGAYEYQGCGAIPQNLLANPGFETGDATGWMANWGLKADSNQVHDGNYSGLASGRAAFWDGAYQSVMGLMDDGKTYRISGWVRLQNADSNYVQLTVRKTDMGGTHFYFIDSATGFDNQWVHLDGTLAIDINGQPTELYVYFEGPVPDVNFYVDSASVTEISADLTHNGDVDFFDYSTFAQYYEFDCATQDCGRANFEDCDDTVNLIDLAILVDDWLTGV